MTPIQKPEKENTVESWWNAFIMVPEGSEEQAYCQKKVLECANREKTLKS